jgi:hypothetical protein
LRLKLTADIYRSQTGSVNVKSASGYGTTSCASGYEPRAMQSHRRLRARHRERLSALTGDISGPRVV